MISSLLIAHRGEIARRIIKTAQAMGVYCVLPYTQVDQNSPAVFEADEAIYLDCDDPRQIYLDIDTMLRVAQQAQVQAVHPGYGFLSERAAFAQACVDAGLIWVGPSPHAIEIMGDKAQAKDEASKAGLPLLPCSDGSCQDDDVLFQEAQCIGFPLLIKASAGGGGKGMRRVDGAGEFQEALSACRREAQASFGDDRVLLESYIPHARHIEVQLLVDQHGQACSLFERDCSLQRRYQKVIEEAPAPDFPTQKREDLKRYAQQLAKQISYVGAGTIEFLYDPPSQQLYFMEMNTRLQVEHPVTEMITDLDLVAWQLRIAAGEALPASMPKSTPKGHAIEVRVYAEDTQQYFLPIAGRCSHVRWAKGKHIRVDASFDDQGTISPYFDPMIAKVVAWGENREEARQRLLRALSQTQLFGIQHNLDILQFMLQHPDFINCHHHTQWIEQNLWPNFHPKPITFMEFALASICYLKDTYPASPELVPQLINWRMYGSAYRSVHWLKDRTPFRVNVQQLTTERWLCEDQEDHQIHLDESTTFPNMGGTRRFVDQQHHTYDVMYRDRTLWCNGLSLPLTYQDPARISLQESRDGQGMVATTLVCRSPMPSRVVRYEAIEHEYVDVNTPLMILEAMKMEHVVVAPASGKIQAFLVEVGEQVDEGRILLEFHPKTLDIDNLSAPSPSNARPIQIKRTV